MNDLKQEAKDRITFNTGDRERDACWESAVYTLIDEYIDKATAQEKKRCADAFIKHSKHDEDKDDCAAHNEELNCCLDKEHEKHKAILNAIES